MKLNVCVYLIFFLKKILHNKVIHHPVIFSIDGTESEGFGKYVNDCAPSFANSKMKLLLVDRKPVLCLFACVEGIKAGSELR